MEMIVRERKRLTTKQKAADKPLKTKKTSRGKLTV
jgi:hypothetical protein